MRSTILRGAPYDARLRRLVHDKCLPARVLGRHKSAVVFA